MFGAIVVTLIVAVIVVGYMLIVNRMLRSDENWNDSTVRMPATTREVSAPYTVAVALAHT